MLTLQDLISHLKTTIPALPDKSVNSLIKDYGLSTKDAITLLSHDDGDRMEYFVEVMAPLCRMTWIHDKDVSVQALGKAAGNWYVPNVLQVHHSNFPKGTHGAWRSLQRRTLAVCARATQQPR